MALKQSDPPPLPLHARKIGGKVLLEKKVFLPQSSFFFCIRSGVFVSFFQGGQMDPKQDNEAKCVCPPGWKEEKREPATQFVRLLKSKLVEPGGGRVFLY